MGVSLKWVLCGYERLAVVERNFVQVVPWVGTVLKDGSPSTLILLGVYPWR